MALSCSLPFHCRGSYDYTYENMIWVHRHKKIPSILQLYKCLNCSVLHLRKNSSSSPIYIYINSIRQRQRFNCFISLNGTPFYERDKVFPAAPGPPANKWHFLCIHNCCNYLEMSERVMAGIFSSCLFCEWNFFAFSVVLVTVEGAWLMVWAMPTAWFYSISVARYSNHHT